MKHTLHLTILLLAAALPLWAQLPDSPRLVRTASDLPQLEGSEVIAANNLAGMVVVTSGRSTPGDGEGGSYYYTSTLPGGTSVDGAAAVANPFGGYWVRFSSSGTSGAGGTNVWNITGEGVFADTVSALPSLATTNRVATALGFSASGDGGGGLFYYSATLPVWAAGTNLIVLTNATGGYKVRSWIPGQPVNVLWAGATVAEGNNDTAAINLAADVATTTGSPLYFPAGWFQWYNQYGYMPTNTLTIRGEGMNNSFIVGGGSTAGYHVILSPKGSLYAEDVTFTNASTGIRRNLTNVVTSGTSMVFDRCAFTGMRDCINGDTDYACGSMEQFIVRNCVFKWPKGFTGTALNGWCANVKFSRVKSFIIDDNMVEGYPMGFTLGDENGITGNNWLATADPWYTVQGSVSRNWFQTGNTNGVDGTYVDHASQSIECYANGITIEGNTFWFTGTATQTGEASAVYNRGKQCIIRNNRFIGCMPDSSDVVLKGAHLNATTDLVSNGSTKNEGFTEIIGNLFYGEFADRTARGFIYTDSGDLGIIANNYFVGGYKNAEAAIRMDITGTVLTSGHPMTAIENNTFLRGKWAACIEFDGNGAGDTAPAYSGVMIRNNRALYMEDCPGSASESFVSFGTGLYTNVVVTGNKLMQCANSVLFRKGTSARMFGNLIIENNEQEGGYAFMAVWGTTYTNQYTTLRDNKMSGRTAAHDVYYASSATEANLGTLIVDGCNFSNLPNKNTYQSLGVTNLTLNSVTRTNWPDVAVVANTYAEVVAATLSLSSPILTASGYAAAGDGGGGTWVYAATLPVGVRATNALVLNNSTGGYKVFQYQDTVDARVFGMMGNGSDITALLVAAQTSLKAGDTLWFGVGTNLIASAGVTLTNSIKLAGVPGQTVFMNSTSRIGYLVRWKGTISTTPIYVTEPVLESSSIRLETAPTVGTNTWIQIVDDQSRNVWNNLTHANQELLRVDHITNTLYIVTSTMATRGYSPLRNARVYPVTVPVFASAYGITCIGGTFELLQVVGAHFEECTTYACDSSNFPVRESANVRMVNCASIASNIKDGSGVAYGMSINSSSHCEVVGHRMEYTSSFDVGEGATDVLIHGCRMLKASATGVSTHGGGVRNVRFINNVLDGCGFNVGGGGDFGDSDITFANNILMNAVTTGTRVAVYEIANSLSVNVSTNTCLVTLTNHGLRHGNMIMFQGGSLPSNVSSNVGYYVVCPSAHSFAISERAPLTLRKVTSWDVGNNRFDTGSSTTYTGDMVLFDTPSTNLPSGVTPGVQYILANRSGNTYQLKQNPSGSLVTMGSAPTGTAPVYYYQGWFDTFTNTTDNTTANLVPPNYNITIADNTITKFPGDVIAVVTGVNVRIIDNKIGDIGSALSSTPTLFACDRSWDVVFQGNRIDLSKNSAVLGEFQNSGRIYFTGNDARYWAATTYAFQGVATSNNREVIIADNVFDRLSRSYFVNTLLAPAISIVDHNLFRTSGYLTGTKGQVQRATASIASAVPGTTANTIVYDTVLTGNMTVDLDDTQALPGDWITVVRNAGGAYSLEVRKKTGAVSLYTFASGNNLGSVTFTWDAASANWVLSDMGE
jgi:hypothetical protein